MRASFRVVEVRRQDHPEPGTERREDHLGRHTWFSGDALTMADFQMSFAIEAALARGAKAADFPHLVAYREKMVSRPAYQRAVKLGGPVVMR